MGRESGHGVQSTASTQPERSLPTKTVTSTTFGIGEKVFVYKLLNDFFFCAEKTKYTLTFMKNFYDNLHLLNKTIKYR